MGCLRWGAGLTSDGGLCTALSYGKKVKDEESVSLSEKRWLDSLSSQTCFLREGPTPPRIMLAHPLKAEA